MQQYMLRIDSIVNICLNVDELIVLLKWWDVTLASKRREIDSY